MSPGPAAVRITYLGHATVLIELSGLRILTDPVLRPRVAHLIRRVPVPEPSLLEGIDVVLVSHAHHDHLDAGSLRALPGSPRVLCPPAVRRVVARAGLRPTVLVPGATERVGSASIEAIHADHDGRRWALFGDASSLGFVVRGDSCAIYFAGDTGLHAGMRELAAIDVALLPVAGWGPRLGPGHLGPREAAEAAAMIEPAAAVPIHWGTLERIGMRTDGAPDRPAREFVKQLSELAPGVRGELLRHGESLMLAPKPADPASSAWRDPAEPDAKRRIPPD